MSQHEIKELPAGPNAKPGVYRAGNKIVTVTGQVTKVEQSHKHLTDINLLLEPAMRKGLLRHTVKFAGQYDDIPVADFRTAMSTVAKAKSMYEELPANIRKEFKSPEKFLEFVQNPANGEKLKKLGMLKGNDGLTAKGTKSGAPTPTDVNADGIPDPDPT